MGIETTRAVALTRSSSTGSIRQKRTLERRQTISCSSEASLMQAMRLESRNEKANIVGDEYAKHYASDPGLHVSASSEEDASTDAGQRYSISANVVTSVGPKHGNKKPFSRLTRRFLESSMTMPESELEDKPEVSISSNGSGSPKLRTLSQQGFYRLDSTDSLMASDKEDDNPLHRSTIGDAEGVFSRSQLSDTHISEKDDIVMDLRDTTVTTANDTLTGISPVSSPTSSMVSFEARSFGSESDGIDDNSTSASTMSSMLGIESENGMDMEKWREQNGLTKFAQYLDAPTTLRSSRGCVTEDPPSSKKKRNRRRLNTSPWEQMAPQTNRTHRRNWSVPGFDFLLEGDNDDLDEDKDEKLSLGDALDVDGVTEEPVLQNGQLLQLAFTTNAGMVMQVSNRTKRQAKILSKSVRCHRVSNTREANWMLKIIGHTRDGAIRGGDRISLVRSDGSVLRRQTMSSMLRFSTKMDERARFVVGGVPEGLPVTENANFYLQSSKDTSKIVGFVPSKNASTRGHLGMYEPTKNSNRAEPVQLFKLPERSATLP